MRSHARDTCVFTMSVLYIEWRHQQPAPFVFVREMVRADFDCRSRLRGFYGLLTVPALVAWVILICIDLRIIPLKIKRSAPVQFARRVLSIWLGSLTIEYCFENRLMCWYLCVITIIYKAFKNRKIFYLLNNDFLFIIWYWYIFIDFLIWLFIIGIQ